MAFGMFLFSGGDALAKLLTGSLHPVQVVWARQMGLLCVVLLLLLWKGPGLLRSANPGIQISRGALAAGSAICFIIGIRYVPLADAVAVTFVAPFLVTVLGALILGEKVGPRRWMAVAIGFLAVLIVFRPGLGVFHPAMLLILIAACFFALRQIVSRVLSGKDPTETTVAYTALTASLILSLPLPFFWQTPNAADIPFLVGLALLAAIGEVLVIKALELAEAVALAPIHYSLMIWGTFYGYVVFGDFPDIWTWIGAGIIMITGLYVLHRERLARGN